jgi:hypothetical protein
LKAPEPLGLAGYPAGNLLQISGDVREFDPKAADPVRKPIDQAFAVRSIGRIGNDRRPHRHRFDRRHSRFQLTFSK